MFLDSILDDFRSDDIDMNFKAISLEAFKTTL